MNKKTATPEATPATPEATPATPEATPATPATPEATPATPRAKSPFRGGLAVTLKADCTESPVIVAMLAAKSGHAVLKANPAISGRWLSPDFVARAEACGANISEGPYPSRKNADIAVRMVLSTIAKAEREALESHALRVTAYAYRRR
jgi:hypothetical protein